MHVRVMIGSPVTRLIRIIGGLDYVETIPLLVEALDDPHPQVRSSAATALLRVDKPTRLVALKGITLEGDKSIMQKLIDLCNDKDAEVSSHVTNAIDQFRLLEQLAGKSLFPKIDVGQK